MASRRATGPVPRERAVADRFSMATGGGRGGSASPMIDRPEGRRGDERPRRRATRDRGSSAGTPTVERSSRVTDPCSTSTPRTPPASSPSSVERAVTGRDDDPRTRAVDGRIVERARRERPVALRRLRDRSGHRRGRAPRPPARVARAGRARRDPRDTDRRLRTPGDGHRPRPAGVPRPVASAGFARRRVRVRRSRPSSRWSSCGPSVLAARFVSGRDDPGPPFVYHPGTSRRCGHPGTSRPLDLRLPRSPRRLRSSARSPRPHRRCPHSPALTPELIAGRESTCSRRSVHRPLSHTRLPPTPPSRSRGPATALWVPSQVGGMRDRPTPSPPSLSRLAPDRRRPVVGACRW